MLPGLLYFRWNACKNIGLENVDVRVEDFQNESIALVELNRYRQKTATQLLNEITLLEEEYSKNVKMGRPKKNGANSVPLFQGRVRERISKLIGMSNGNIQKLKYIHKNWPEVIPLIDEGKATINHVFTEAKRREIYKNIQVKPSSNNHTEIINTSNKFKIYNKSSMHMDELDDGCIQTIMTSPPYYNQRNYGNTHTEAIGLEDSVDEYIDNVMSVMKECSRVLSSQGSLFLNLGDKYKKGSLLNIPHRIAIKMVDDGWFQRNLLIWRKLNAKPESVKNRWGTSHEFIFFFTKQRRDYYFNIDNIREEYKSPKGKYLADVRAPRHHNTNGDFNINTPVFPHLLGKAPVDFLDVIELPKASYGLGKEILNTEPFTILNYVKIL